MGHLSVLDRITCQLGVHDKVLSAYPLGPGILGTFPYIRKVYCQSERLSDV